jgi:hypothetical protein
MDRVAEFLEREYELEFPSIDPREHVLIVPDWAQGLPGRCDARTFLTLTEL